MPDTPAAPALPLDRPALESAALRALDLARGLGASDAEAECSASVGQSVTVRLGEVETVEYNRDKALAVTVYFGQRRGNASTSDLSADSIRRTVEAACAIARHTAPDEAAGLPDAARLYRGEAPGLDLFHPWCLTVEEAIAAARETEAAARAVDARITNSEGATVSSWDADFVFANSLGFAGGFPSSRASIGCGVVATEGESMQRDYWYSAERDPARLEAAAAVGRRAGERAVRRLGARRVATAEVPVLFEASVAGSLVGHFVSAASGSSLYRRSSFLVDAAGKPVFSPLVTIAEEPHLPGAMGSCWFDGEGVATQPRRIVDAGVLTGYFLSSYSARKLGLETTGNAGGSHNLVVAPGDEDFAGLVRAMGRGLVVTELMGQGVNPVTGDYSRGAVGFWVEGGEIRYPVEEVTIAGNLAQMYRAVAAVGRDVLVRGSRATGSILVERMTVAGH
ncbi:MAG TPA: metalloprotease PmbA [Usitatibacteraceae bacterium]|jgi:PmbA protein|nr:metalloprotease PmbA [Usitatibacteraceae bacterium]HRA23292.1 metalloprotease PmbA [Usitatibacteraceae bacterium]